jgi:hypothetical protein
LESLDDVDLNTYVTEVWFFSKILNLSGSGINTEKPLDLPKFDESISYNFSYDDMSFYSKDSGMFSPNHVKFVRLLSKSVNPTQLKSISGYESLAFDLKDSIKQSAMMHKA